MSASDADTPKLTTDVSALPPRPPTMHKGMAGRVAVIAGSRGMSGAAILTGLGALRGGAGLVRVCCTDAVQRAVAAAEPCLMTVALPEEPDGGIASGAAGRLDAKWADVIAIGPGLGQGPAIAELVNSVLRDHQGPAVVDADALNTLAAGIGGAPGSFARNLWRARADRATVVTPHPGEMARLRKAAGLAELSANDDTTRLKIAHEYACHAGVTVVLKGHRTVVCAPTDAYINTTGNPGMAAGGMGDVLTGLIAALLGQGVSAFEAARLGVYAHGLAADHCAKHVGPTGYLAREVADELPGALLEACRPKIGYR